VAATLVLGAITQILPAYLYRFYEDKFERAPLVLKVAGLSSALFLISVASPTGVPPFIYYQF
jgi:hypothetical protein